MSIQDEERCDFSDLIRYSCSHCTGRVGDEDLEILEL